MNEGASLSSVPRQLVPLDKENGNACLKEFLETANLNCSEGFEQFLAAVFDLSPFLRSSICKEPELIERISQVGFEKVFEEVLANTKELGLQELSVDNFMREIRVAKRQVSIICGLADLGNYWRDKQVTTALSTFAKASLSCSIDFLLLQEHTKNKLTLFDEKNPQNECGLIVLGMGKLGANELNYSSDIDIILLFDGLSKIELHTDDPITFLSRLAKLLVRLMQERTSDGYVFRVDLRLRPDPSSTPLVLPVEAALHYYEGQGLNWERAAMIKARAVCGDIKAGESFLRDLNPFIWRKYLDFAAIKDIHSIKQQIHTHKGHGIVSVLGHNIKLGRGGIREIEFFAQTQQLIAGGREPKLRTNETIEALVQLCEFHWINEEALEKLTSAYHFLRDLEHRLQMVNDQQTHTLPDNLEDMKRIALMSGREDVEKFCDEIRSVLTTVQKYFDDLFDAEGEEEKEGESLFFGGDESDPDTLEALSNMGYQNPDGIIKTIKSWQTSRFPALRTLKARDTLSELTPHLLRTFCSTQNPDETLYLFDRFIGGLPAGIQFFVILQNNPGLSKLLLSILTSAPRLADQIARKPHVFDAMLDPNFVDQTQDKQTLLSMLKRKLERADGYEAGLDQARLFFQEIRFLIGCQYFSGLLSIPQVTESYTLLGEVMVCAMLDYVRDEFEIRHGSLEGAQICVLGMGRLGSHELTATSDLDLIFLYDYDPDIEASNGEKPLVPSMYFIRFMKRFITAMSSPTAEGIIYELDFRLRPSGNAGPLATDIAAFEKYQKEEAWVWESQSLTRARPIAGDRALIDKLTEEIPSLYQHAGERVDLEEQIFDMRQRIGQEKGSKNFWDVKLVEGGLIDIEFIAQYLTLKGDVKNALPTRDVITHSNDTYLNSDMRQKLSAAMTLYENVLHMQRICLGDGADMEFSPKGFVEALCERTGDDDFASLSMHLSKAQAEVSDIFNTLFAKENPGAG